MRTLRFLTAGLAIVLFWGCSNSESYSRQGYDFYQIDKVAVVDVVGSVENEAVKDQIADFFVIELLKKGYSPIERSQVQILLNEQKLQTSDITSGKDVTKAGMILHVPVLMIVNIPKLGTEIELDVKMLEVKDGSVLWMGSAEGTIDKPFAAVFGTTANAIGRMVSSDPNDPATKDAVEGTQDTPLTPEQEKVLRELVGNVCQSLPKRR